MWKKRETYRFNWSKNSQNGKDNDQLQGDQRKSSLAWNTLRDFALIFPRFCTLNKLTLVEENQSQSADYR